MAAFYRATLAEFLPDNSSRIVGVLSARNQHNELQKKQIKAWSREIEVLKSICGDLFQLVPTAAKWSLLLEYPIPRRHKRLDAVLLAADVIFCLEFKTEDKAHSLQSRRQVEDYALDLRDFHGASRDRRIVPVVVIPKASSVENADDRIATDTVRDVKMACTSDLAQVLLAAFGAEHSETSTAIDPAAWDNSAYQPVPTIIEAAEALFAGHDVSEIVHHKASKENLTVTSRRLVEIIRQAQDESEKLICFVTGVPGAGKTLAGLNVVHNPELRANGRPAGVFLSGNGPLVNVVSAALSRDHRRRMRESGGSRTVGTFIQTVQAFINEGLEKIEQTPVEHVIVFDEAQRAWNLDQNLKKKDRNFSEPEIILSIMDRHRDWAVIVALVGGGQEIHSGEGGLSEWGKTLREKFPAWKIVVSPKALEPDISNAGQRLFDDGNAGLLTIRREPSLHLSVNLRSFRASHIAEWVDHMLTGNHVSASALMPELCDFPLVQTRSIHTARKWLRDHARGQNRAGLVASSGALRLRADGLEVSSAFRQGKKDMFIHWFLDYEPDVRCSNQLEVAATEFECQGLELDWVGLCWGDDFHFDKCNKAWEFRCFKGSRWNSVRTEVEKRYLLNKYRVLLTRARQGLVIWVPRGNPGDHTRLPMGLNATADYLAQCGVPTI